MSIALKLLRLFNPETAHNLGLQAMKWKLGAPGVRVSSFDGIGSMLFNTPINSPIGLAAGFDKNGYLVDVIEKYGFGFMEVGSVTHLGGIGNPRPRMFRLDDGSIMNRMGLNGEPAIDIAKRLSKVKSRCFAVNIAKTHSPDIMGEQAIVDICSTYQILKDHGALGFYTVLNLSCPNTPDGRSFSEKGPLTELMHALNRIRDFNIPLLVKLSPIMAASNSEVDDLTNVCNSFGIKGYICSNTVPFEHDKFGRGGLSGNSKLSLMLIKMIKARDPRNTIIGCGGVFSGDDAMDYLTSGCSAVQVYNGFVSGPHAGPRFAHTIIDQLEAMV